MMAFLRTYKSSKSYTSISRVVFYSTETSIIQQKQISKKNDDLYSRISPVGDPNVSMIPIIDQWEKEGKSVSFLQLVNIIKSLRKFNRYTHALQLSEWMANRKGKLPPGGVAVHLDLVSRVQGIEQAEKYFDSIPDDVKKLQVYGALLNCYATTKSVEKAEATAEKMRQMGVMTTLSYDSMLNLYKIMGDNEKLDKIHHEMIEMGVPCDEPTYYIRLSAYASASDLEGMERVLKNMEESSGLNVDWNVYIIASGGYIKSGKLDKAFEMLKKSEEHINGNSKGAALKILLRMYATLGKKEDVYRIWKLYKSSWSKVYNRGYSSMMGALVKLDDIDGAEKLLAEWESEKLTFDFRIPNMLINAYCIKDLLAKAEAYVGRVVDMGKQPPASTWVLFATAYTRKNEMEKAVEMLRKCVNIKDKRGCKLDHDTFRACVEYLKGKGDLEGAEEIERSFKGRIRLPRTSGAESLGDEISDSQGYVKRKPETSIIQQKQISKKNDDLYSRISPVGDPNVSMIPIIDQWEKEGKSVSFLQLVNIIKSLRKFNRYTHALQLSEWMANRKGKLPPGGVAVHLDLVSSVQGIEQAEKYFDSIPDDVKKLQVYGALLNCYATTKSVEKAEATAEKMRQMGMMTTLSYNSMLNLYKIIRDNEKLDKIYQEMIEMGVPCDKSTYHIKLSAYASASDLEGMERVLKNMEESSGLNVDWHAYVFASGGYIKSGKLDKAFEMLKKSEEHMRGNLNVAASEILLRMYATLGKKEDVYRIWMLYKSSWSKVYNRGYSSMMRALVKLDDIDGAEKLLAEWESEKLTFDFRIPNMLINAYCKKDLLAKAEAYVGRVVDMGKQPPASTRVLFATAYTRKNEMEKAVEMLRKCVNIKDKRGCKLDQDTFRACVEYLKGKGDLEGAEEIERSFKGWIRLPRTSGAESLGDEISESQGYAEMEASYP